MKKITLLAVLFFAGILFACHFDPEPPTEEELNQNEKNLYVHLTGFPASRRIWVEYTDGKGTTIVQDPLYISRDGSFYGTIHLSSSTSSYSIIVTVDQSGDGASGTGDKKLTHNGLFPSGAEETWLEKSLTDFGNI